MAVSRSTTVVITVGDESATNPPADRLKRSVLERFVAGMYLDHRHHGGIVKVKVAAPPATVWHDHHGAIPERLERFGQIVAVFGHACSPVPGGSPIDLLQTR
jgi:hypothetical protein